MEFKRFKEVFQQHIESMLEGQSVLFVTDTDPDTLWDLYLNSFPDGTNEIYRERRSHDCSCCRAFIRQFGNVVAIGENYETVTIWDFDAQSDTYQPVVDELAKYVVSKPIKDLFVTRDGAYGTSKSHEQLEDGSVHTWHHFRVDLPKRFRAPSHGTLGALAAKARTDKEVLKRSLDEISPDAVETVLDLVIEKSLYRGEEWGGALGHFQAMQNEYHALSADQQDNYCWFQSVDVGGAIVRIRNHSIGVLLQDLTAGMDVLEAVGRYEKIVAPENYKRPKPIFTERMIKDARETVERLGLTDSLPRRHARLDDIKVNDTLWSNKDAAREMEGLGVFDALADEVTLDPRKFENLPGVDIKHFIANMLPAASRVEVLLENRHEPKLVSLIAPQDRDASSLFKWNNFGWAYNGNVTDSMKQRVKALGGDVTGVLRFSIQWNENNDNRNDFDAHCIEPGGNHIYYPNKGQRHTSSGMLDVDIISPGPNVAVENITWSDLHRMRPGTYQFFVHNYSHRGGRTGFRAEVEFSGRIYEFNYPKELRQGEKVQVAKVHLANGKFEISPLLPTTTSSKEVWGLMTNRFHPVSVVCYSPNYWDDRRVGNRHYFFMLAGCVNPEQPSGFFNEYLKEELMQHKRVFAALGSRMRVEQSDTQLSGVGFSSTTRASLIVKVDGQAVKIII